MGGGEAILPLLVSAAGTAATISAEQKQQDDQRRILNRQMERNDQATKNSTQQVLQEGQRYDMSNRQQGLQDAENRTFAQTQADLQGAGGAAITGAADAGNVSDDFLKTKAARAIEENTRLTDAAREAARTRAPGQLQMDDSLSMANLAGNLQNLWGTTKQMASANGLDAQGVQAPGYGNLGKVATAVGTSMASNGYGQTAAADGGSYPPNPYATGPYRRSGVNFGAKP
jgi:hypothetical protein